MKNQIKFLVGLFIIALLFVCAAKGQTTVTTNPINDVMPSFKVDQSLSDGAQIIWDNLAGSTNFAVVAGVGRGIKGNKNLAFVDYVYNISDNVGLILGYDGVRVNGANTYNFVKGGLNLKADIKPLKNFGIDWTFQPFAALVVTSRSGNIGQAEIVGVNKGFKISQNWNLNVGGFYESRNGGNSDPANGVYLCGMIALSRGF